jgi:hypothetical protein
MKLFTYEYNVISLYKQLILIIMCIQSNFIHAYLINFMNNVNMNINIISEDRAFFSKAQYLKVFRPLDQNF